MSLIVAVLPEQVRGRGIVSRIYREDKTYIVDKTPTHFLDGLYKKRGKSKAHVDKNIRANHQIKRNTPYVISKTEVFFPFKYRKSTYDKQNRGFVNVRFVKEVKANNIILITGEEIASLSKESTLVKNKLLASCLAYEEIIINMRENESAIRFLAGRLS